MEEGTIATVDRWGINPLGAIKVVVDWNAVLGLADSIERDIQKGLLNGCLDLILSGWRTARELVLEFGLKEENHVHSMIGHTTTTGWINWATKLGLQTNLGGFHGWDPFGFVGSNFKSRPNTELGNSLPSAGFKAGSITWGKHIVDCTLGISTNSTAPGREGVTTANVSSHSSAVASNEFGNFNKRFTRLHGSILPNLALLGLSLMLGRLLSDGLGMVSGDGSRASMLRRFVFAHLH